MKSKLSGISFQLSAALLLSCATTATNGTAPTNPAEEFFPLAQGNAWSYDVDGTLVVLKVQTRIGDVANLGEFSYEVHADGIVRIPPGKYVLQSPAAVGREWALPGGGKARITSTDARVSTPGGDYSGCLVVEETDLAGTRTLTTFARGVGPVDVIVTSGTTVTHAKLRGFTRAGEEI